MIAASLLQTGWSPAVVIPLILRAHEHPRACSSGSMIHVFKVQPFIATLAAMFLARGLCYVISQSSISITDPTFVQLAVRRASRSAATLVDHARASSSPSSSWRSPSWVLHDTRFGRTVYAIGGSEQSGLLMGLPVARTKVLVYVISGFCSGLAGVLFTFYTLSGYPLTAIGTELDAIAAVVIGGTLLTGGYGFVLGIGARRAGARRHPDDHHVRGNAVVVVDEDLHRRAAAGLHHPAEGAHRETALRRGRLTPGGQDNRRNERADGAGQERTASERPGRQGARGDDLRRRAARRRVASDRLARAQRPAERAAGHPRAGSSRRSSSCATCRRPRRARSSRGAPARSG